MQITLYSRDLFWGGILVLSIIAYVHSRFSNLKLRHRLDILEIEKKQAKKEKEDIKEKLEDGKEEKKPRKRG